MHQFKLMLQLSKTLEVLPLKGEEHLIPQGKSLFLNAAKENEVFVMSALEQSSPVTKVLWTNEDIDAPFNVFSVEFEGDYSIAGSDPTVEEPTLTKCIMVEELPKDKFRYYVLVYFIERAEYQICFTENPIYYSPLIKMQLDRLNKGICGVRKTSDQVTFKKGKKKTYIRKEREFIICDNKSQQRAYSNKPGNSTTEWDHSISVRGHWRRQYCLTCKGEEGGCSECDFKLFRKGFTGMNRKGERIVPFKTWIPHTVKREDSNPIKKIRKVKT